MNYQIASLILITMYFVVGVWVELHDDDPHFSQMLRTGSSFRLVGTIVMSVDNIFVLGQG